MDSLLRNTITAIRAQMAALDQMLDVLEQGLAPVPAAALACPKCGSTDIHDLQVMGPKKQYACSDCDFRGPLH